MYSRVAAVSVIRARFASMRWLPGTWTCRVLSAIPVLITAIRPVTFSDLGEVTWE